MSNNNFVHQPGSIVTNTFMSIQYWDKWMPHDSIDNHTFILTQGKMKGQLDITLEAAKNSIQKEKIIK